MALRIELKPRERILIGECVITNSDQRTQFLIEGRASILRDPAACPTAIGELGGGRSGRGSAGDERRPVSW